MPLLDVDQLVVEYPRGRRITRAVDGVSFTVAAGETVGLVGESGCGKSTLGRSLLGLTPIAGGSIRFAGTTVSGLSPRDWQAWRPRMQMVFQDPYGSLNPRQTVRQLLETPLRVHGRGTAAVRDRAITSLLDAVGLARASLDRYPHAFSGGQRQRIGIARALILKPEFVVCDEAVSALDVSIQAQILNLLIDLKSEFGLSYLFISHDLSVVRHMADRVLVMRQGKIVESGSHVSIWRDPQHAYTRELLAAVPSAAQVSMADTVRAS